MKILVTGGLGFIGSNFIEYMLEHTDHIIVNIDKCDYMASEDNVSPHERYTYIRADITERYHMVHIFKEHQPDIVIHFAAQSCVDRSFDQAFQFTKDNVLGTHVLLETVKDYGKLKRFIHISTDEVYGEVGSGGVSTIHSPLNPSNPYSASKAAAEIYVRAYGHSYGIPIIITRGNNVFGPKQYPEKVIPLFITQILRDEPCTVHGDGHYRRNFIYVDDVSRAVHTIMDKGEIGATYNIGTKNELSVTEVFERLVQVMGRGEMKYVEDPRPFNDSRYCIDSSELRALGWEEQEDFMSGLAKTVASYELKEKSRT